MTRCVGVGERGVNSNRPVVHRSPPRRRPSHEQARSRAFTSGRRMVFRGDDLALAVVHYEHAAGLQVLRPGSRARRTPPAAPAGGCRAPLPRSRSSSSSTTRTTDFAVASSSLSPSFSSSFQPVVSAYGRTVCTHRVLLDETIRVTSYAASSGTSRSAWSSPDRSSGRSRSSRLPHDFRDRADAWRSTTSARVFCGALAGLGQGLAVAGVGEQLLAPRRTATHDDLVDLVVDQVAAHVVVADDPALPVVRRTSSARAVGVALGGQRPAQPDVQAGLLGDLADRGDGGVLARGRACPWGRTSRRTRGRCTSSTCLPLRVTTAPAASTSRGCGMALVSHHIVTGRRTRAQPVVASWSSVAVALVALVAAGALWWRAARHHRAASGRSGSRRRARSGCHGPTGQRVRSELGADLSASSSSDELTGFLDEGFDADLTSTSALLESAAVLHERFGFSPATIDWELFSQSTEGAVITLRLPDSADFDELARRVWRSSATRARTTRTGVWRGGPDLLPEIGPDLTPELQYVALDADEHLVRTSDTRGLPRARRSTTRRRAGRGRRRGGRGLGRAAVGGGLHRRPTPAGRWRCRRPTPPTRTRPTS